MLTVVYDGFSKLRNDMVLLVKHSVKHALRPDELVYLSILRKTKFKPILAISWEGFKRFLIHSANIVM